MGLPIFITPVEPEVASRATEKVAAVPRSSIRRQRTVSSGNLALASENRRRRIQDLLEADAREIGQTPSTDIDIPSILALRDRALSAYRNERLLNERSLSERVLLREPLSWERRHRPDGIEDYSNALPPAPDPESEINTNLERERERLLQVRTSREREIERLHQVRRDLRRMGRRRPAPTPPYTETDIASMARGTMLFGDSSIPSALTPARSPIRLTPPEGDAELSSVRNTVPEESSESPNIATRYRELREEHIRDRAERADRVQAFNRASSSNVGPSRSFRQFLLQARMDGLGDRDRSLSPEGGNAWDTLLTSITPDPQPPSAGSSFASSSAAAAAASSSSNSGPTWVSAPGASMTSLGRTDESSALRDCDVPTSSDSNTEDEDEELEDLNNLLRSSREEGHWRSSYADVTRASRGAQSPDSSLEGMHHIIARLAERDDIPESWWASVGLRREPSA